jgi:acyl-CoA synthetase (AMP-forming)/AMP-acid ligase II
MLIISGRQTAVLNLGGEKIAPESIEEVIAGFDAAIAAGAALVTTKDGFDQICVAIESKKPIDIDRLREHCRKQLPAIFMPKRFITMDRVPRNAMGKLDRAELRRMLETELIVSEPPGARDS